MVIKYFGAKNNNKLKHKQIDKMPGVMKYGTSSGY